MRGGYYNYGNGSLSDQSSGGFYWYWQLYGILYSNNLKFYPNYVNAQYFGGRGNGFIVRCLDC